MRVQHARYTRASEFNMQDILAQALSGEVLHRSPRRCLWGVSVPTCARRDSHRREDSEENAGQRTTQKSQGNATKQQTNRHTEEKPNMKAHAYTEEFLQQVWPQSGCSWSFRGPALGREPRATENRTPSTDAQRSAHTTENFKKDILFERSLQIGGLRNSGLRNWKFRHVLLADSRRAPYVVLSVKQA